MATAADRSKPDKAPPSDEQRAFKWGVEMALLHDYNWVGAYSLALSHVSRYGSLPSKDLLDNTMEAAGEQKSNPTPEQVQAETWATEMAAVDDGRKHDRLKAFELAMTRVLTQQPLPTEEELTELEEGERAATARKIQAAKRRRHREAQESARGQSKSSGNPKDKEPMRRQRGLSSTIPDLTPEGDLLRSAKQAVDRRMGSWSAPEDPMEDDDLDKGHSGGRKRNETQEYIVAFIWLGVACAGLIDYYKIDPWKLVVGD